jgi:calcineurin-like phosphoesterase family protein
MDRPYNNHFLTSDLHLFHEKSIQFDNRPFKDIEHMHEELVKRYNVVVPQNGVTYFLGDVGMGSSEQMHSVISRMNGIKIAVMGNHDRGVGHLMKCGFTTVMNMAVFQMHGKLVSVSHCPLRGIPREKSSPDMLAKGIVTVNWHGETKNQYFSAPDFGQTLHCHGHLHSRKDTPWKPIMLGNQIDISCVSHNYRPVPFTYIEKLVMNQGYSK